MPDIPILIIHLQPKQDNTILANVVLCLSYLIGKKRTLLLMAKTERQALETYKPFVAQYPELEPMRLDEGRHCVHCIYRVQHFGVSIHNA